MAKYGIRTVALGYLLIILVAPLGMMIWRTLEDWDVAWSAITDPNTIDAFKLTLLVTAIAVPVNTVFGIVCGLAIVRKRFPGRGLVNAFVDLPLALSPVIVGLSIKYPNLYMMTSAYAPKYLPQELIQFMNTRGQDEGPVRVRSSRALVRALPCRSGRAAAARRRTRDSICAATRSPSFAGIDAASSPRRAVACTQASVTGCIARLPIVAAARRWSVARHGSRSDSSEV